MIATVLVAAALATPPPAPAFASLDWLAGCWRRQTPRRIVEETWMAPAGGLLLGSSRTVTVADGALVEYEQVRIEARGDTLVYVARPSRQPEATFIATEWTDSLVLFENAAHDFPQRIGYRRVSADSIAAWIEGTVGGKARRVEFPYGRVACPGGGSPR